MTFQEEIIKIRTKFKELVQEGLGTSDVFESTLINLLSECEKNRANAATQAENLRKQAMKYDGEMSAWSSMSSIIWHLMNTLLKLQRNNDEAAQQVRREEEEVDKAELMKKMASESKERKSKKT